MKEEVISCLKQGYTFREIQDKLSLDTDGYLKLLQSINTNIKNNISKKSFYSDGSITNNDEKKNDFLSIITRNDEDRFRFLVISDTHIGSINDNLSYLDLVYDYCVKNNIYYIIHAGDLIDGTIGIRGKRLDLPNQIDEVIEKYPYEESIINLINLGNHDFDSIVLDTPIDKALIENRDDLIPIGYGTNEVHIKNDSIVVNHFVPVDKTDKVFTRKIILKGHSHRLKIRDDHDNYHIYVPSLSGMDFPEQFVPGFLDVIIEFHKGYCNEALVKSIGIIDNKIYPLGLNQLYLGYKMPRGEEPQNIMEYIKRR